MQPLYSIVGCGDIGRRVLQRLLAEDIPPAGVLATARSSDSLQPFAEAGVNVQQLDLDGSMSRALEFAQSDLFYTVPPPRAGSTDARSAALLRHITDHEVHPRKVVLISTSGVYGDCRGGWVDESTPARPTSERAQRRLDSEQRWLAYGKAFQVPVVVLRVPGIYARTRLPVSAWQRVNRWCEPKSVVFRIASMQKT